jgi:outer membrane receptor protein involved in Fe transport
VVSFFAEDQYRATRWLTLNAGLRFTRFAGTLNESSTDPRVGAVIHLPRLKWSLRASYGRYYQPPPLFSVAGPLLDVAAQQGFSFLPLHGEKDEQHEIGLTIPWRGWTFDFDHFRTGARNFFDHDVLGNSNIFFPLTIARARIRGYEATVKSPRVKDRVEVHLAYSRQWVQGKGGVTGGLTDFSPPPDSYFYLDHDQRNTLSVGANASLPAHTWASFDVVYGSGFLNGDGFENPTHLTPHSTLDLSAGKDFGKKLTARLTLLNVTNNRYLLDNSNTFGGTHYANPREVSVQLRYKFRY